MSNNTNTFERVSVWNALACKPPIDRFVDPEGYWAALENQAKRIQEELDEVFTAIKERDLTEVLDGGCDLDVTVSGLNGMLGVDYAEAITRVLDNNDVKLTEDFEVAQGQAMDLTESTGEEHLMYEADVEIDGEPRLIYSVHRVSDDKVCKLPNHPRVDLSDLVK